MSTDLSSTARHSGEEPSVTAPVEIFRATVPVLRPLLLAIVATALIMIGLPAVLALGAAAGT